MSKTPNQTTGYFAVRKGKPPLRNCLFLNWDDCKQFLDGCSDTEYAVYDRFEDALQYLSGAILVPPPSVTAQLLAQMSAPVQSPAPAHQFILPRPSALPIGHLAQASPLWPILPGHDPPLQAGPSHAIDQPPCHLPASKPFEKKRPRVATEPEKGNLSAHWRKMLRRLKEYKEEHGTLDVSEEDENNKDLVKWMKDQRKGYAALTKGAESGLFNMTEEKVDLLRQVGFHFQYYTWDDRFCQLETLLEENEDDTIDDILKDQDPGLVKWAKKQSAELRAFIKGEESVLTSVQAKKLDSIGMNADRKADKEFEDMFQELEKFKKLHGNCNVPVAKATTLSRWVARIRAQYKKLKEGKPSALTAERMMRLNDLGFVFAVRGKTPSWEQRIEMLQESKAKYGCLKFSLNESGMRSWIGRQRHEYRLFQEGKSSNITQEKIDVLSELGMVWETNMPSGAAKEPRKTWEERFEELVDYIKENGHSIVPQNTPGLGEWVHTQRTEYKKMQGGRKTAMTPTKALKLIEVGFCFDAVKKRGRQAFENDFDT